MDEKRLSKFWIHSFEEDRDGKQVFRPDGHPLPLARGRDNLDLRAGEGGGYAVAGPDDRPSSVASRWRIVGDKLELMDSVSKSPVRTYKIVTLEDDELVVERVAP